MLSENDLTLDHTFVDALLRSTSPQHRSTQEALQRCAQDICAVLLSAPSTHYVVEMWALGTATDMLSRELAELSKPAAGFHFNAANAAPEQLGSAFISRMQQRMKIHAPHLWNLTSKLLDADPSRRRVSKLFGSAEEHNSDQMEVDDDDGVERETERDYGEFGGENMDELADESASDSEEVQSTVPRGETRQSKRRRRAVARNEALITIVNCIIN